MHLQDVMDDVVETGRKLPIHNVTSISLTTERRSHKVHQTYIFIKALKIVIHETGQPIIK